VIYPSIEGNFVSKADSELIEKLELLLDVRAVARLFEVSTRTIWRWVDEEVLPRPYVWHCGEMTRWSLSQVRGLVPKYKGGRPHTYVPLRGWDC
jgi:predicted DNA-binding transcriptional regulator AlpA